MASCLLVLRLFVVVSGLYQLVDMSGCVSRSILGPQKRKGCVSRDDRAPEQTNGHQKRRRRKKNTKKKRNKKTLKGLGSPRQRIAEIEEKTAFTRRQDIRVHRGGFQWKVCPGRSESGDGESSPLSIETWRRNGRPDKQTKGSIPRSRPDSCHNLTSLRC